MSAGGGGRAGGPARPYGVLDVLRQGNLAALALPIALLAIGWVARGGLARKTVTTRWRGVAIRHPAGWAPDLHHGAAAAAGAGGGGLTLVDLFGPGRIKPRVTVQITPVPAVEPAPESAPDEAGDGAGAGARLPAAAPVAPRAPSGGLPLYYAMAEQTVQLGAYAATRVDSAFAFTPRGGGARRRGKGKGDIPVVMRAIDLVILRGGDAVSVQVAAPIDTFEADRAAMEAIAASVTLDPSAAPPPEPAVVEPAVVEPAVVEPPPAPAERPALAETPPAAPGTGAVLVVGQVLDAASGLPVAGAIVLFLRPGKTVDDVAGDDLSTVAFTTGLAGSDGRFASARPLERGARYGVLVVAEGYRFIGTDDGVAVDDPTGTLTTLDVGAVRLRAR